MRLYIIRHGEPDYERDCLTDKGRLQAHALAKRLAVQGVDRIFSSPNGRARETAKPTCDMLGLPCAIEDWASENYAWRDFHITGPDGTTNWAFLCQNSRLKANPLAMSGRWYEMEDFRDCLNAKGGYERLADASDGFLSRLGYVRENNVYRIHKPNEEKVALFCHGGMGSIILSHMLAIPPVIFWATFDMTHTGVTILDFNHNTDGMTAPSCLVFSDISHIYKENLSTGYFA
ncbi:MAG: histidine phosphatase family protein [Oscillospiraceae bacterium]|jgi:probable phosphoglycerate mutase|nr:histidine phosphatase family protein [Oscillospiraceae bacterium]